MIRFHIEQFYAVKTSEAIKVLAARRQKINVTGEVRIAPEVVVAVVDKSPEVVSVSLDASNTT